MQQKQKEIEDQNKLKKAAIQETIKTRYYLMLILKITNNKK